MRRGIRRAAALTARSTRPRGNAVLLATAARLNARPRFGDTARSQLKLIRTLSVLKHQAAEVDVHADALRCLALSPDGATVFLGGQKGEVCAVRVASGEQGWVCDDTLPTSLLVSPDGAIIFIGTSDGKLHALEAGSGACKWTCELGAAAPRPVVMSPDGASIFLGTQDGELCSVATASGERRWTHRVGEATPSDWSFRVTPDGATIIFWAGDGRLHALAASNGQERWVQEYPGAPPHDWSFLASPDGSVISFTGGDSQFYAIASSSGQQLWRYDSGQATPSACTMKPDGASVFLATSDGQLHCVSVCRHDESRRTPRSLHKLLNSI